MRAKKVDMKKLKAAIWEVLTESPDANKVCQSSSVRKVRACVPVDILAVQHALPLFWPCSLLTERGFFSPGEMGKG